MISIVTGTLNRKNLLINLIKNTVNSDERLELVLVDGGSNDGTIEYLKELNHPKIKLIEVGGRSSYPHFMNLGIENASYEWVCQWNDDALLVNQWEEVISEITDQYDFYPFSWKYGSMGDINNKSWLDDGWKLCDLTNSDDLVVNYGLYNKNIFREIGLYSNEYNYYYADADMSFRAHSFGYLHKSLKNIKVCSIVTPKTATHYSNDEKIYKRCKKEYKNKILNNYIKKLK